MVKKRERPINIPEGVKVKVEGGLITVEGNKGKLERYIPSLLIAEVANGKLLLMKRKRKEPKVVEVQGLFRALISNMIKGVTEAYEKILEIIGVGYRAKIEGEKLSLFLGFSHPIEVEIPKGLDVKVEIPKGLDVKTAKVNLLIKGIDKELVGNFAALIRRIRPPDPYKGKGIRYQGEYVRHKVGKAAVTTTV